MQAFQNFTSVRSTLLSFALRSLCLLVRLFPFLFLFHAPQIPPSLLEFRAHSLAVALAGREIKAAT